MTDPRPAPQYGEYATPLEQAKAMGLDAVPVPEVTDAPAGVKRQPESSASLARTAPASLAVAGTRPRRGWDLGLTVALLTFGAYSVISTYAQYADLTTTLNYAYTLMNQMNMSGTKLGAYTSVDLARTIGIALNATQIVVFVVTALVSILLLRRNRIAFYVPLIGAALTVIVTIILMFVALTGDPAYMATFSGK
ncbi:DUF6264 family protein [Glaciihabitans sp. dw_435]|uniref:DUF6264 family protein n=1 Tax=Glaciihabitans sp. dw_435 TaxID=2720081 RepID=UPI001BD2D25C|nr:DUF6264 family protein [Glaciihabitans sp. dw_435]